jgi:sugar (pentulose or hexulose) kinase
MRTHLLSALAAVVNVPVSVMSTAGGGGAWGMALLAADMLQSRENQPLEAYLSQEVFLSEGETTLQPDPADVAGFSAFMERYKKGFKIERIAVEVL